MHCYASTFSVLCKSLLSSVYCTTDNSLNSSLQSIPAITLYQYNACPFCCKVKAYFAFRQIPYRVVEVDPVSKKQIKFSKYRNVPFVVMDDKQINDSSVIISAVESLLTSQKQLDTVLTYFPEIIFKENKKDVTEILNKYVIAHGHAENIDARREEAKWREWVDTKYVHDLPVNIYRTLAESFQAFNYITQVDSFSPFQKFLAKYMGSVSMYVISKRLRKKYNIDKNVRNELFKDSRKWMQAIGSYRTYLGGHTPNLADISLYGVISSIEGLDTFNDLMSDYKQFKLWYYKVRDIVHPNRPIINFKKTN